MEHYVYKILNTLNGKVYIGQTNNSDLRWSQHRSNAKYNIGEQVITRAMIKYGIDAFKFEVIAGCKSQENVNVVEVECIRQYDSRNPEKGYNVDVGGREPRPADIGARISEALKKHYETHDGWMKGKKHTEESRQKMSESSMGKPGTN